MQIKAADNVWHTCMAATPFTPPTQHHPVLASGSRSAPTPLQGQHGSRVSLCWKARAWREWVNALTIMSCIASNSTHLCDPVEDLWGHSIDLPLLHALMVQWHSPKQCTDVPLTECPVINLRLTAKVLGGSNAGNNVLDLQPTPQHSTAQHSMAWYASARTVPAEQVKLCTLSPLEQLLFCVHLLSGTQHTAHQCTAT